VQTMNEWLLKLRSEPLYRIWKMEELQITDQKIYAKYIQETKYESSVWSSNFSYLWAHIHSKQVNIFKAMIHDLLVTFILTKNGRLYLPCLPLGRANAEALTDVLLTCSQFCLQFNQKSGYEKKSIINPINSPQLKFLSTSKRFKYYFKEERLTGLERHYSIPLLLNLTGKNFSKIRNKLNKFKRMYPHAIVRNYYPSDYLPIMKLGAEWEETSGAKYKRILDGFYFEPIIKHAKELGHIILVVELDDQVIGMTTGEILPTGQAWGCITKFIKDYQGVSEFLTIEMAKKIHHINPNVKTINVGSDLGSKGLAFFKERFRPVLNYERYALFFQSNK